MAQPTPYSKTHQMTEQEWKDTLLSILDTEFDNLDQTLDKICANLVKLQRDDGKLANSTVHLDSLDASVYQQFADGVAQSAADATNAAAAADADRIAAESAKADAEAADLSARNAQTAAEVAQAAAEVSAADSSLSASEAGVDRIAAENAKTLAEAARGAAQVAQTAAEAAQAAAEAVETNAGISEANASGSANAASTSETNASNSASAAGMAQDAAQIAQAAAEAAQLAAEQAAQTATDIASGNHNGLTNRDAADAHPMSAITGLGTALAGKLDKTAQAADSAKLGGVSAVADAYSPNSIVKRTNHGDVVIRYADCQFVTMSHGTTERDSDSIFFSGTGDGYIRKNNQAGMLASLGVSAADGTVGSTLRQRWSRVPSLNQSGHGIKAIFTAGEALSVGDVVYNGNDNRMYKADADLSTKVPARAICLESITSGSTGVFLLCGMFRNDSINITSGGRVYLSVTAGKYTVNPPSGSGDQLQILGWGITSTTMFFNPDLTVVELA